MNRLALGGVWLALLLCPALLLAEALPEPLHLHQALHLASDSGHPDILKAQAYLAEGLAERDLASSENDVAAGLSAGLRMIEPARRAIDQDPNDSYLRLDLSKRLYDSGRQQAAEALAEAQISAGELRLLDARQQRQLEVMRRFFEVLLADLRHVRNNEAMAIAYIGMDRARSRVEIQQLSELDLMAREQDYQRAQQQLRASDNARRMARAALALALNRPGQLSTELRPGKLTALQRTLPEQEALIQQALAENPRIVALRREVQKERERIKRVEAEQKPTLTASIGAAAYARELGSYNPLAAELTLEVPLFAGQRNQAELAKARSGVMLKSAELKAAELQVQQRLIELWMELQDVHNRRQVLQSAADYHEMNLDRSRTLYQMEVSTDLGDSMVRISQQRLDEAELNYRAELLWAELDALAGRLLKRSNS